MWGLYLLVSVNVFGRHGNEAFSPLRIQDYKSFLRMRLRPDRLTVYPLGVRKVPRRWRWKRDEQAWEALDKREWELIDGPIEIDLRPRTEPASAPSPTHV